MAEPGWVAPMNKSLVRWKKEWTEFVAIAVALRLFYALVGLLIVSRGGPIPLNESVYVQMKPFLRNDVFSQFFINPWFGWDTISYLRIAMFGYGVQDSSVAFMPLYPILIRLASPLLGGDYLLTALMLSTLFSVITLILLYELFAEIFNSKISRQAVILFISFPTAFFLFAGYTESLFLTLVLAFWILGRRKRWYWAALFSGLATLTRLQGLILAPVLLWMMLISLVKEPDPSPIGQVRQVWELFKSSKHKIIHSGYKTAWLTVLTPVLVALAYQTWLYASGFGSIPGTLQEHWKIKTVMPWTGIALFFQRLVTTSFIYMDWIDLALFVVVLLASLIGLRLFEPAFSLYIWMTIGVLFTRGTPPFLLASYSRYFLVLFPLFVLPALSNNKSPRLVVFFVFSLSQILLVGVFLWGSWVA